ncbi:hypothetical protein AHF37_00215 [Paragonimus kellicotti]|nr:hypothetical protein AHF37_00215 [Paragonimus kellicotti]
MKIDRKKIVNRRLSECPDNILISELKKISVWNYGKCELGLWANVLDRLDTILEHAVTKVGRWMLRLDLPENTSLVEDVVTILEFTGHLIEHSIYRYLYGSWNHILTLFGSENMDILLAVLGLSYNFSKRSNYFVRLDPYNKKMVLDRLVSIAETWGGAENNFGLAACCDPAHFPETAGNVYFEYRPEQANVAGPDSTTTDRLNVPGVAVAGDHMMGSSRSSVRWPSTQKIILHALHRRNQSPSKIMEELLALHPVPSSKQMALFARVRLATYFSNPEQRHKCIRARLQALSILSYTFEVDERHLYPSLLDELVEVLELPDGQHTGIKACALRTMTAIVNSHRLGVNWASLVGSTGLSSYHGILPYLTRRWVQGLVDGTIQAPGGSVNQQFTTALLSFLYHLACYEENVGPGNSQNATLSACGVLDSMLQLISWHTSRNDCLSYVTRAVRVTDQILMSISVSRPNVVEILVDRLSYEADLVLNASANTKISPDLHSALNTQHSGLTKSILNLIKRLCLDTEWGEVMHTVMEGNLPDILRRIFLNGTTHFTPHLALFAMESITNYLYTHPSRISAMQDKNITTDILTALTSQPLPQNRDFLVQLPGLFNTLALNARGIDAIQSSGVLNQYLETLVSPDYLPTMKTKRVRDFLSQVSHNFTTSTGQGLSNSLTASQMSTAIQELLRSHSELKPAIFQGLVACLRRVVEMGNVQPATLIAEPLYTTTGFPTSSTSSDAKLATSDVINTESPYCQHLDVDLPCLTAVTLDDSANDSGPAVGSGTVQTVDGTGAMLEEDVVMLSGGEEDDEDNGIDGPNRTTQTQSSTAQQTRNTARMLDSRSVSPSPSLILKEGVIQSVGNKALGLLPDGSPIPPHMFLPDFMLNTCKFLEKLLPSVLHVSEAMCLHFIRHGGLQVLCDLLHMPGLPYDFPVSAACASLCKIFEDLANSVFLNDAIKPLFQCLESSLEKLTVLQNSNFSLDSILLREYATNEHTLLHELVVTASIVCILVQIIDHLKPELRPSFANKWIGRSTLQSLGRLYLSVSWEAGVLLKLLYGDKDITEADIVVPTKKVTKESSFSEEAGPSTVTYSKPSGISTKSWKPVTETSPMPQFVEALHIYALLKPSKTPVDDNSKAFLHRRPDLVKATHRILHVTAFLINSVSELCIAWGRFFASRNQTNYRRRRMTLLPSEQIPNAIKQAALSQITHLLCEAVSWEPSPCAKKHPAAPGLILAIRYSAIRLTNALLHDSTHRGPQGGMMTSFFMQNGIERYFGLFHELTKFDLNDPRVSEPLTEVLQEWLTCADWICTTEFTRSSDNDTSVVESDKFLECVHQNMLYPLEQLCIRTDLQSLLTRRAVEHLLSMLVAIVPYLFNNGNKAIEQPSVLPPEEGTDRLETTNPEHATVIPFIGQVSTLNNDGDLTQEIAQTTPVISTRERGFTSATTFSSMQNFHLEPVDLPPLNQPDSPVPPPLLLNEVPPSLAVIDSGVVYTAPQPMDTTESDPNSTGLDSQAAASLRLMEEMGFSREVALVALEQTGWNANEAVNLVIATPEQELLTAADTSVPPSWRLPSWTEPNRSASQGMETIEPPSSNPADSSSPPSQSAAATALHLASAAASLISSTETAIDQINTTLSRLTNLERERVNTPAYAPLPPPVSSCTAGVSTTALAPDVIKKLRDSLKQHVFRACYTIAKHHHSDQILHRVAELLLSSGEEERYVDELFGFVANSMSERLGIRCANTASSSLSTSCSQTDRASVKEQPIVGLHLSALLFTRCQSLCARLAWKHNLPQLLISWIARLDLAPGRPDDVIIEADQGTVEDLVADYYKTLLLSSLIIDQYERSIQAIHLRRISTKLYSKSHIWNWFDDRAMIWHPYTTESARLIDLAFHKGDLCAYCHISRRPYAIEFPTMTQVNLDSLHRRPVLLFPSITEESREKSDKEPSTIIGCEDPVLEDDVPPGLTQDQQNSLLRAIFNHFASSKASVRLKGSTGSSRVPIPSDCIDAVFRLLLRLSYSSYENAQKLADNNLLAILLTYPHSTEFTSEYSLFVGALITQMFDDAPTVMRVMKEVFHKVCQFGVPSNFMGIGTGSTACRDLFYLLSMCVPMFAKDRDMARKLACETISLSLSDGDVTAKTIPKSYTVETVTSNSSGGGSNFSLTDRQKGILTQLLELVLRSTTAPDITMENITSLPVSKAEMSSAVVSTSSVTPDPIATSSTWASGLNLIHLANQDPQQSTAASALTTQPQGSTSAPSTAAVPATLDPSTITVLGKTDVIRYLIDLIVSYQPVAEFIALYKPKASLESHANSPSCAHSFLAFVFSNHLTNAETSELTSSLLENLVLIGCESTQDIIISEYKASLGRISSFGNNVFPDQESNAIQFTKNECLTAHMLFLERLLSLPSPLVDRLIRLVYRRHLPADIAKLVAVVDCNLPNTQSTLSTILRTLESLTWVDRQLNKLATSSQERRLDEPSMAQGDHSGRLSAYGSMSSVPATTSSNRFTESMTALPSIGALHSASVDHVDNTSPSRDVRPFESDTDDDDDDDTHDIGNVERAAYPISAPRSVVNNGSLSLTVSQSDAPTNPNALNLVLDDVIMTGADIVLDPPRGENRTASEHWRTNGEQDDSVVFVHDDEDEGSAGQGGEGGNSQDEDDVLDEEDDAEAEDGDDEDAEEDENDDDDDEVDDDGAGDTDEEVITHDGEVALVLRAGSSRRRLRGSRRPRTDATISVSVSSGRIGSEHEPTASAGEAVRAGYQRVNDELSLHGDPHDDDGDGSFDEDEVDTYGQDDEGGEDLGMLGPEVDSTVYLNADGRVLRENNSVVAMVEEVLNLIDVPHQGNGAIGSRASSGRRDRLILAPSEFGGLSVIPSGGAGTNWGFFLPRVGGSVNADGPLRGPAPSGGALPPNTTVFRFGLGNSGNASVFVTGGNNSRLTTANSNLLNTGNTFGHSAASRTEPPSTLASQHPLLQVPSNSAGQISSGGNNATTSTSRLGRGVVTSATTTSFTTRMTSILPPTPPVSSTIPSAHFGNRSRLGGVLPGPVVIGSSGVRQRGPPTRLYAPFTNESGTYRSYSPGIETGIGSSHSADTTVAVTQFASDARRDNRSGPEADALVWGMLTSIAMDQPTSVNSALASVVFSQVDSSRPVTRTAIGGSGGLTLSQLTPYAGYALPASYRRWINLSRMLFGHELMDLVLISRYEVYKELSRKRQASLEQRVLDAEQLITLQTSTAPQEIPSTSSMASSVHVSSLQTEAANTTHPSTAQPSSEVLCEDPAPQTSPLVDRTLQISDETVPEGPQTLEPETIDETTVASTIEPPPVSTTPVSTRPPIPPVPMTDEETVQSLVEGGMDPSFLDALPEDMRREVIADHRHARQVQQQLSSTSLSEHINADWLAGLPPHIQEEVLVQFRNEQRQQTATGTTERTPGGDPTPAPDSSLVSRPPESNTAFLISLPASLRRELLTDMDESQLEMLPPDLIAEARQLRRENEERFARAVQGSMLTHSFTSRQDHDMWRNLTSATGLIGGPGRWDVRFSSINDFLRHLNSSLGGGLSSNALVSLQNISAIRGRHLVDHEGLTCLIALLIASSACSQQRRHVVPALKKVLRNLSCHFATRNWIVGTILLLFEGLSEKYHFDCPLEDQRDPSTTALLPSVDAESRFSGPSEPASSNTVFHIGFEAALGCWVRIFHPTSETVHCNQSDLGAIASKVNKDNQHETAARSSKRHHIIHPQAAVSVSSVLLETLGELAKAFPIHFYPPSASEKKTETESGAVGNLHHLEWPRPVFWDIFDRLSDSTPNIGPAFSVHGRSNRRTHCVARKRQSSTSNKVHSESHHPTSSTVHDSLQYDTLNVADTPHDDHGHTATDATCSSGKPGVTEPSPRRRPAAFHMDYFTHLTDLLCHPLIQDRPSHQERLLTILAGIVKEFHLSKTHPNHTHVPPTQIYDAPNDTLSRRNTHVSDTPLVHTEASAEPQPTSSELSTPEAANLIAPLRPEVVKVLCHLVCASKSTDNGRSMAAQLITDLARANQETKELMLHLLSDSVGELTSKLCAQLQDLINELGSQTKAAGDNSLLLDQAQPSSSVRSTALDVLPDRFSGSGQVVIISGDLRPISSNVLNELQLKSVQNFSCPNNDQSRLRGILGLILRITAGESSTNSNDPVPVCVHDPFQSIPALNDFWPRLSSAFEKLQTIADPNAILLLQPLLEAFCLAHLFLLRDCISLRQRSVAPRPNRPTMNSATVVSQHSLMDMVPVLILRVDPASTTSDRIGVHEASTSEHTTHLHLDVMGPMSPPSTTTKEDKAVDDVVECRRASTASAGAPNAILQFADRHRTGLNHIFRQHSGNLGESPFAVFLAYPRVLDFDIKRRFFRQQLQSLLPRSPLSNRYDDEPVMISRDRIFEDSYARLHRKSPAEWKHKFVIRFQNEEGQDAGGPLREWYLLMSREIFNPNYCLFRTSPADRVTYTINPSSYINSNHLSYFKFVGRFIAKAIYDNKLLECYFSRSFYKHILGVPVKYSDLESEDYDFYKGLEFLLKNRVSDLGYELTFSTEINEFGKTETRDLIENGRNVHVTEQNKREYVRLVCQERMIGAIRQQLDAFLGGFYEIIPKRMISIFNEQELELLISGLPNIDIADLKANTTYTKYQPTSPQIEWFWRALESFDQEDRARFLQFVTGTSKVPLGGFANLEGMHGPTKFQISRASVSSTNYLPCAHTCFNTLVLPAYEVYEQLRSRLLTAIRECSEGYGMA